MWGNSPGPGALPSPQQAEDELRLGVAGAHPHAEQNATIAAYVRRRNARATPKTDFAPASPIRTWTQYPAKAA